MLHRGAGRITASGQPMLREGLFGTRADLMMDIVVLSLAVVLPVMAYSYANARRRNYRAHKRLQTWLTVVLFIAVSLFEIDLQLMGGVAEMARGGKYYGTPLLSTSLSVHLVFSVSTFFLWIGLVVSALWSFPTPPVPTPSSHWHRLLGRIAMVDMVLTAVTGIEVYLVAFAL